MAEGTIQEKIGLIPISGAPMMQRVNGIGVAVAGWHNEPLAPGLHYKQWVFTIVYLPIMLGTIYLVEGDRSRGWRFLGQVKFSTFIDRFGWPIYLRFLGTIVLESGAMLVALILALILALFVSVEMRSCMRG